MTMTPVEKKRRLEDERKRARNREGYNDYPAYYFVTQADYDSSPSSCSSSSDSSYSSSDSGGSCSGGSD